MRVLVTGGAGFIGSHVADELVTAGHEVRVLDALLPTAHDGPPPYLNADVDHWWGDVTDPDTVAHAVEGCDAVTHQAAMVGLGVDFADVENYCHHNDLGTARLLGALHRTGFAGRLVVASSMVVYGEGRYRCRRHGDVRPPPRTAVDLDARRWEPRCSCGAPLEPSAVTEDAPTDPRNVYAATKLHQEHLAMAFEREHRGVTVCSLRYHNVYGPRMPHDTPYAGVASLFRSSLAHGRPPRVFEDGAQLRDFIHVRDVARANRLALTVDLPRESGAYNVATGDPRSILDMATVLSESFGDGELAPEVTGGYRLGDVRHVFASPAKAQQLLGFRAEVPFVDGLQDFATASARPTSNDLEGQGRDLTVRP